MNNLTKEYIEEFLDEFIPVEHRWGDQTIARTHYKEIFVGLSPKFF